MLISGTSEMHPHSPVHWSWRDQASGAPDSALWICHCRSVRRVILPELFHISVIYRASFVVKNNFFFYMDVNFSLASQTLIVGAEAWSSFIQWDMEGDAHSYSVGWQKKEVISEREHSAVKSSITATALYHCNYIFQMQMIALRILPLVHRLQEQFGSYFSVGDKSRQRLRTGESHPLCLFPFLWRCLLGRNTANCRGIWRGFLTRVFCWQSCCCCLSSKESDLCVARRELWSCGREETRRALLLSGVAPLLSATPCFESLRNMAVP